MSKLLPVLVLLVLGAALSCADNIHRSKDVLKDIRRNVDICKAEVGATDADVAKIASLLPSTTNKSQCLRACFMKRFNMMDKNGRLVVPETIEYSDTIHATNPERMELSHAIIKFCSAIPVPEDHCQAAELYEVCIREGVKHYDPNPD